MGHIIKPLLRHRLMPLLVVLQVAIACAIACNALFLLQQRLIPIVTPDGVAQPHRLLMVTMIMRHGGAWPPSQLLGTRASLLALPGVGAVSAAATLPMETNAQMSGDVAAAKSGIKAKTSMYVGNYMVDTLGLKLVAGRDFSALEQATQYKRIGMHASGPTIITRALADSLFPGGHALGKVILIGKPSAHRAQHTVVGIVAHLMRNEFDQSNRSAIGNSMLIPGLPGGWPMANFAVRIKPTTDVAQVRKAVQATIKRELGADMIQGITPHYDVYADLRDQMLAKPRAVVWLLSGVSLIVLIVAMVGIMGMTSYWVQQRTRQIGIRRALGARRRDILRYIQIENLLVVGVGVVLGLAAAYGINFWLMQHFELARLPWTYLPIGAALLLVLGQLAVLKPALSAARVPPVVATRSV